MTKHRSPSSLSTASINDELRRLRAEVIATNEAQAKLFARMTSVAISGPSS